METGLYPQRHRSHDVLRLAGWLLLVALGAGLTWYGFTWTEEGEQRTGASASVAASAPSAQSTPSAAAPSMSSAPLSGDVPQIVAGADGANVRTGPGTAYARLGYLEPGARAEVTGRDGKWWQIRYGDAPGWVFGDLVTALEAGQSEPQAAATAAPAESPSAGVETWPAEVFQLINQVRVENGLPPYTYNETLEQVAQLHGQDCQERGECDHSGSDGSNAETRIRRAGYDPAGQAEVIVYSSSPQAAVAWWMDEVPPDDWHRRTLLSTWVTEVGVAVVPTGRGDYYFIADFGRPN